MVTDLPLSFLLFGDIYPKCRVLINSFANRRGERRRWLINNYGRGTIHISLNKRVIQGGWVEDEPESRARETYPADKSSLIRVRDLYRPSVNWILKCRWWGLGDCGAVCRAKRPHIVTTTLQYSKALLYTRRFCSHATRVSSGLQHERHDFLGHRPSHIWMCGWLSCLGSSPLPQAHHSLAALFLYT